MKFLVDEQLPPALARWIERQGHQAEHVYDAGLLGMPDIEVARRATEQKATLVTKDEDFASRAASTGQLRVVWLRIGNVPNRVLLKRLDVIWPDLVVRLNSADSLIEIAFPLSDTAA